MHKLTPYPLSHTPVSHTSQARKGGTQTQQAPVRKTQKLKRMRRELWNSQERRLGWLESWGSFQHQRIRYPFLNDSLLDKHLFFIKKRRFGCVRTRSVTTQWTWFCAAHPDMNKPIGKMRVPGTKEANTRQTRQNSSFWGGEGSRTYAFGTLVRQYHYRAFSLTRYISCRQLVRWSLIIINLVSE